MDPGRGTLENQIFKVCLSHTSLHNYGQSKKKKEKNGRNVIEIPQSYQSPEEQCYIVICDSWYNISDFNKQKMKIGFFPDIQATYVS